MHELDQILEAWDQLTGCNEVAVLATVVEVRGSAYRRPGARMLITAKGERFGSVSAGCLEGHVARDARRLTQAAQAVVRQYDTTSPDDAIFGSGLGCNGIVRVLLERLGTTESCRMIDFLKTIRRDRKPGVMCTITNCPQSAQILVGSRFMTSAREAVSIGVNDDGLLKALREEAGEVLEQRKSRLMHFERTDGRVEVFLELIPPAVSIVIFGAGQDAIPLTRIARQLGWHVTLVDRRDDYANLGRFPDADVIVVARPEDIEAQVSLVDYTAALVMNHDYLSDRTILEHLLRKNLPYIGMLGPAARTRRMLRELRIPAPPPNLYAPMGLDIGADAPATIAIAICAEVQAVLAGRNGRMLRERRGPIYERPPEPSTMDATAFDLEAHV